MEGRPDLRLVRDESSTEPASRPRELRLGLSWLDRMAAASLVEGTTSELREFIELVRSCAESLAGEDGPGARRRLLSREIAIAKVSLDATTAAIGDRMRSNDAAGAMLADKLATSAAKRLAILLEAHRTDTATERRTAIVAIGHAEHVTIDGEK